MEKGKVLVIGPRSLGSQAIGPQGRGHVSHYLYFATCNL